jgi:hypothetical protein
MSLQSTKKSRIPLRLLPPHCVCFMKFLCYIRTSRNLINIFRIYQWNYCSSLRIRRHILDNGISGDSTVGWADFGLFYIFNKSTPEICYIPSKSTDNSKKKFFDPVTSSSASAFGIFWSPYCEKNVWTSIQCMTQNVLANDEEVTGSKHYFIYFRYFWKVCNKPQGYFCPNSNINPPYSTVARWTDFRLNNSNRLQN